MNSCLASQGLHSPCRVHVPPHTELYDRTTCCLACALWEQHSWIYSVNQAFVMYLWHSQMFHNSPLAFLVIKPQFSKGFKSRTGSIQPREDNWVAAWSRSSESAFKKSALIDLKRNANHIIPAFWTDRWFELQLSTAQARRQKKLQHPTRPVEKVALTTKGLQERKTTI